jgi:hypothetical protein
LGFVSKYTCMIAGAETVIMLENIAFSGTTNGVQLRYAKGGVSDIRSLQSFHVDEAGGTWVRTPDQKYTLDDDVQVYVKRDSSYYLTSWELADDLSTYSLTAFYDKPDAQGGRVRVVIATER